MKDNSSKPETIKAYIAEQNEELQAILLKVHEAIRSAAPNCVEKMSWQMPTYWQGENLIHFCVHKNHLGIYPGLVENIPFQDRLAGYKVSKGAIQLPFSKPIDYDLIADITRWRVSCIEKE